MNYKKFIRTSCNSPIIQLLFTFYFLTVNYFETTIAQTPLFSFRWIWSYTECYFKITFDKDSGKMTEV
jgi:hypothetical protein